MFRKRIGLATLADERAETRAVVAVEPDLRADPEKPLPVLRERECADLREPVGVGEAAESCRFGARLLGAHARQREQAQSQQCAFPPPPRRWPPGRHGAILPSREPRRNGGGGFRRRTCPSARSQARELALGRIEPLALFLAVVARRMLGTGEHVAKHVARVGEALAALEQDAIAEA